ncbi:AMP-binding protein [Trebonia sp.]|uniref:AMP-binding protein n=1 Tax=Trebonia sp. TaxID=2767075 RepID=UPI00262C6C2F|nr:AMP-binding protein [Trebonia sp.]
MNERPLHAVLLSGVADAARLIEPLAAALAGGGPAIAPLDAGLPAARLRQLLDALRPEVVVGPDGDATARSDGERTAADTAVIIGTSGSTGDPKGVELSAAALLHSARASLARLRALPGQRWLCCLPVTHVAGLQVLVRSQVCGTAPATVPALGAQALAAAGASHVSVVPAQLARLLADPAAAAALAQFSSVLVGGAAAAPGLVERARAAGVPAVTTYGMSETCGGCVYDGVPLDGVSVRAGADGLLRIRGPVLMNRYHGQPDLAGEFVTSDLGYLEAGGRVVVRGRADDAINTGGFKVIPGEVAAVLADCPGVREVVVVGRPDPVWGERVTAIVVPADHAHPPSLELLRTHVRTRLPRYASPGELVLTDAIPVLPTGKPDLASLKNVTRMGTFSRAER